MSQVKPLLKDQFFNDETVGKIATEIKSVYQGFDREGFETDTLAMFPELELKERLSHISEMLKQYLPKDFKSALEIIQKALPDPLDEHKSDNDFGEFIYAAYGEYIARHGCNDLSLQISLETLREITKRFSVEYAIRDFLNRYPEETLEMLESCSNSMNYHERRLASEGLRPKLPWAKKLTIPYENAISILNNLYMDKTRFVTRSVANHLNDISKIDPDKVIELLKRWRAEEKQECKEMEWISRHALRTLIKRGDSEALEFLGYMKNPDIKLGEMRLESLHIRLGKALIFHVDIEAKSDVNLLIDYVIHFQNRLGKTSRKVFKIKKYQLSRGEVLQVRKEHIFKADMSTRKLYIGEHRVELQINGTIIASKSFELKE